MVGPFAIDAYLPAFRSIGASIGASPVVMQQTLSAYLIGFAVMTLFHGALSDSFGRKRVILVGVAAFAIASVMAALAKDLSTMLTARALQGMSAGAGMIVGRAIMRDMFDEVDAQKLMSLATVFFGVAPALAPMIGGLLYGALGWQSIFGFLALLGTALFVAVAALLPETLPKASRQPLSVSSLLAGYRQVGTDARFLLLAVASGVPFNGFFIYVLSAPSFLGELWGLSPQRFWWFFAAAIAGIMLGSAMSGRLAGRFTAKRQIALGFGTMTVAVTVNVTLNLLPHQNLALAFAPITAYCFGWALVAPSVTVMVLSLFPERRGMASSLQGFVGSMGNSITAAIVAPLVMHSKILLSLAAAGMMIAGVLAWTWFGSLRASAEPSRPT